MVWALLGVGVALLVGVTVWLVKRAERHGERKAEARQATVDAELMEDASDVAMLPGPSTGKLSGYWDRMRKR
jgi:hypothetical protein